MPITRKVKFDYPIIKMNNQTIDYCNYIKYLGITIDQRMTWNEHVTQTLSKALRITNTLSKMARNTWGIGTDQLKYIYISAIEPHITYGASVWHDTLRKKTTVKKLTQFQRLMALRIIKGYKTISGDAAIVIAELIPLHLRVQESADMYYLKKSSKFEIMGMKS